MRYNNVQSKKIKKYSEYDRIISKRDKNLNSLNLHKTVKISNPEMLEDMPNLYEKTQRWTTGLKLWKLASEYYGDGTLYWVIGLYNSKPTDAHWSPGDIVYVPFPLELAIRFLEPK